MVAVLTRHRRVGVLRPHTCHANGCSTRVPPRMLMCRTHWGMVPGKIKESVLTNYKCGQGFGVGNVPSREWLDAALGAVKAVAEKEGKFLTPPDTTIQSPTPKEVL